MSAYSRLSPEKKREQYAKPLNKKAWQRLEYQDLVVRVGNGRRLLLSPYQAKVLAFIRWHLRTYRSAPSRNEIAKMAKRPIESAFECVKSLQRKGAVSKARAKDYSGLTVMVPPSLYEYNQARLYTQTIEHRILKFEHDMKILEPVYEEKNAQPQPEMFSENGAFDEAKARARYKKDFEQGRSRRDAKDPEDTKDKIRNDRG